MTEQYATALPKGTQLFEYRTEGVLGQGGFGITYLARDVNLDLTVALKEYFPNSIAVRDPAGSIFPKAAADKEDFGWGLERFLKEARTLAQFNHPNIVRVSRFFQANNTAYMVMDRLKGGSLAALLKQRRAPIEERELYGYIFPILEGLRQVHAGGFLHRDVTPGNIFITEQGVPVLIDFGSARAAVMSRSQSVGSVFTPGYAPLELYWSGSNEGPWTDIYSLGACLYRSVTGKHPPEAPARQKKDPMMPAAEAAAGRYAPAFLEAIDWALKVDEEYRPRSIEEWLPALKGSGAKPVVAADPVTTIPPRAPEVPVAKKGLSASAKIGLGITAILAALGILGALMGDGGTAGLMKKYGIHDSEYDDTAVPKIKAPPVID